MYHRLHTESDVPHYATVALVEHPGEGLELAFELTNHIDAPWQSNADVAARSNRERSTSVGDLMEVAGKLWRVAPCGFERMTRGVVVLDGRCAIIAEDETPF